MKRNLTFLAVMAIGSMLLTACATVPMVVPQSLIDARSALQGAKQVQADILVPEQYQEARHRLELAEAAMGAEQSGATVEDAAFEAKAFSEIAEAYARTRLAEQESQTMQNAIAAQEGMLTALTQKQAVLLNTLQQLKTSEAFKIEAQAKAEEEKKRAEEEARKRAEAEQKLKEQEERQQKMLAQLQKLKNMNVKLEKRGIVVNVSGKILFDTGSSKLQTGAEVTLVEIAKVLNEFKEDHIRIEGHTDNTGDLLTNNTLSQARAESVLNFLVQKGVSIDRLKSVGMGPSRPIASNKTPAGRQLNRRVEIIIENEMESQVSQ